MGQFGIGQAVSRFEDPKLVHGQGNYVHDVTLAGQAYGVLLRSPHAHARIVSIDSDGRARARRACSAFSPRTIERRRARHHALPHPAPAPRRLAHVPEPHPGLAHERVRFVGDQVASWWPRRWPGARTPPS